jgi:putative oxidoreductase
MIKRLLTPSALFINWVFVIRVLIGLIIAKHGADMYDPESIKGNIDWLTHVGLPMPRFMAYLGKTTELVGGIFLSLGLFIRLVCIPIAITMGMVVFFYLDGLIFSDAQLPFLLMLFSLIFFFNGAGKLSLDYVLYTKITRD